MAALLLLFLLVLGIATKLDRFQYKRGNHNDHGDNLEVRHDLTSFNFRIQRWKAKRHLFPSCREPEGSTCIITQRQMCVKLCFAMQALYFFRNSFTGFQQKKLYPNTSYTHNRLFSPSILLENSIPAGRSGVVKSTSRMMELRLSNDVTMGKSSRNTADVSFILCLCSNAPTFLRFRRRERFWSQCECRNNTNKFYSLTLNSIWKSWVFRFYIEKQHSI